MNIDIRGREKLAEKLKNLYDRAIPEAYGKALEKAAKTVVQANAKMLCPVDTGYLRNSILEETKRTGHDSWESAVYTDAEYAAYVEFGTGQAGHAVVPDKSPLPVSYREDWPGNAAQPYLYPALKNNTARIVSVMEAEIRKEMK